MTGFYGAKVDLGYPRKGQNWKHFGPFLQFLFTIDRLPSEQLVFGAMWTPSPASTVRGSALDSAERDRHPSSQLLLACRAQPCRRSNVQSTGDQPTSATVQTLINLQESRRCCQSFQTLLMPNKDRPLVDRHPPKQGVGWLLNDQQGKVCSFTNDSPTAHAKWVMTTPPATKHRPPRSEL